MEPFGCRTRVSTAIFVETSGGGRRFVEPQSFNIEPLAATASYRIYYVSLSPGFSVCARRQTETGRAVADDGPDNLSRDSQYYPTPSQHLVCTRFPRGSLRSSILHTRPRSIPRSHVLVCSSVSAARERTDDSQKWGSCSLSSCAPSSRTMPSRQSLSYLRASTPRLEMVEADREVDSPPEIYGWRVFALVLSCKPTLSIIVPPCWRRLGLTARVAWYFIPDVWSLGVT